MKTKNTRFFGCFFVFPIDLYKEMLYNAHKGEHISLKA